MHKLNEGVKLYNSDSNYPSVKLDNKGKMKNIHKGHKRLVTVVDAWYQKMQSSLF
jgi:hypothetical protein